MSLRQAEDPPPVGGGFVRNDHGDVAPAYDDATG
jgi:hypothetical protein